MKIPSLLAGVAGECFVAAKLSRRGIIASISLRNTRGIDILATHHDASRAITIQCKTNQLSRSTWIFNEKSEDMASPGHFYVFVSLGEPTQRPTFHVVPSKAVADHTRSTHKAWLDKPGRDGRRHADNPVRTFSDPCNPFLERWDLLDL